MPNIDPDSGISVGAPDLELLMRQAQGGDKYAYADLLRETARFLRPFLKRKLNAESEVDDLLQEILLSGL